MRSVIPLEEAVNMLLSGSGSRALPPEYVPLCEACGRILARDISASASVPAFDRSSVDGYAVRSADTFGSSESIPVPLRLLGKAAMGETPSFDVTQGGCAYVPTGAQLPYGADAMVMIENAEEKSDTVWIEKPSAPGQHIVYEGDDVKAGDIVLHAPRRLSPSDIGVLSALGIDPVCVKKRPVCAVISTGNEVISPDKTPVGAQVRDINGPMLCALCETEGAQAQFCGIVEDDEAALRRTIEKAAEKADILLVSGGSSVGEKDSAVKAAESLGTLLFHGIAVKPGKPTFAADMGGKLILGLPGHPLAAYFMFKLLCVPLIHSFTGACRSIPAQKAVLTASVPSNNGREEYVPAMLSGGKATPLRTKSGLISVLARSDGCLRIPRDCEGLMQGETVEVYLWET